MMRLKSRPTVRFGFTPNVAARFTGRIAMKSVGRNAPKVGSGLFVGHRSRAHD
jgi:hypothetical protein